MRIKPEIGKFAAGMALAATVLTSAAVASATSKLGWFELDGAIREQPHPLAWLLGSDEEPTLRNILSIFDDAATRPNLDGLVIRIKDPSLNRAQIEELRRGIKEVRDAGRDVYVFADNYGPGSYALAGAADYVLLQKGGVISLPGLYAEEMYLAGTLNWLGIQADFLQVGQYKGASEPLTRTGPSEQWSRNIDHVLDDLYEQSLQRIMSDRRMDRQQLEETLQNTLAMDSDDAVEAGLIDADPDIRELRSFFEKTRNDSISLIKMRKNREEQNIFQVFNAFLNMSKPSHKATRPTVAVLHITGTIIDGDSSTGGMFGGESVGSRTIREALKEIEEDDLVKAVVVRIESPGGSAVASESMWQGLKRLHGEKPVYVSVGSLAASGGYYCAVGGEKIFVNESSIVGSIGVVGGKLILKGLYDKIHLNVYPRSRGPLAGVMSSVRGFSDLERKKLQEMMEDTYAVFAGHVSAARKGIDLSRTAEGRLFTGRQAIAMNMADEIGGLPETIKAAADAVDLGKGEYDVLDYPAPESLENFVSSLIKTEAPSASSSLAATLREIVGENHWPEVRDTLNGLLLMRNERVLLISPNVLITD